MGNKRTSLIIFMAVFALVFVVGFFVAKNIYQISPEEYLIAIDDPNTEKFPDYYLDEIGTVKIDGKVVLFELRGSYNFVEHYPPKTEK